MFKYLHNNELGTIEDTKPLKIKNSLNNRKYSMKNYLIMIFNFIIVSLTLNYI